MTEQEIEIELREILKEMLILAEASALELKSIQFLGHQTNRIMEKADNPNLTPEERQQVNSQVIAMDTKLKSEMKIFEGGTEKLRLLDERFNNFEKQLKKDSNI
jgi:hypothetical protein